MVNNQLKNIKKWWSLARRKNTFETKKTGLNWVFAYPGFLPYSNRSSHRVPGHRTELVRV